MKPMELAVRCTREEYMNYAAKSGKKNPWAIPLGVALSAGGVAAVVLSQRMDTGALLLCFVGVLLLLLDPLILPMLRKGEAGKLYDRSDSLQGAVTLRIDRETVCLRSATAQATLPIEAMTALKQTDGVLALVFGSELTICIPKRVLREDEQTLLMTYLTKEDQTV